jgi:murein DD-endopeptidase MepM/ murein hydrolase activator NlpD
LKYASFLIICFFTFTVNAQLTDTEIRNLKGGRVKTDNSYIYTLPYKKGTRFLLIQAYNSKFSHANELSLDFKMKIGSEICAARDGVITATKEDSDEGGMKDEYYNKGNHVIITHEDGSVAMYWHLKKEGVVVNIGDAVKKGQLIGYSGNTGYTAFPHLHFQVQNKEGNDIATRFYTNKGIKYLRPGRRYKAVR